MNELTVLLGHKYYVTKYKEYPGYGILIGNEYSLLWRYIWYHHG